MMKKTGKQHLSSFLVALYFITGNDKLAKNSKKQHYLT